MDFALAVEKGRVADVQRLLDAGADPTQVPESVCLAAYSGHVEVLKSYYSIADCTWMRQLTTIVLFAMLPCMVKWRL